MRYSFPTPCASICTKRSGATVDEPPTANRYVRAELLVSPLGRDDRCREILSGLVLTIDEDNVDLLVSSASVGKVGDDSLDVLGRWGDEVDDR